MTAQSLVSVLMNCYNGQKYLRTAIDSVLAQTYENWEIIFWDNQSTDHSAEIARSYGDPRINYFYASEHTPLHAARNHAIEKATGTFLAFLDVDDWWLPNKLERQLPLFADPEVGFVSGNYWIESERKRKRWIARSDPAPTGWVLDDLLKHYFVGLLTLVIRSSALESLDYACDPRYHIIGDLDLVLRLSIQWKSDYVQQPVGVYRLHDCNETARHPDRQIDELETWWQEINDVEAIRSSPNAHFVEQGIAYQKAIHRLSQADKIAAYRIARSLPWGRLKLRVCAGLLLPISVFRRIKN